MEYYNALIDALIAVNITPIVTLWHFDLPEKLGLDWTHEDEIMPKFVSYAEFCFARFGDRVKYWVS